MIARLISLITMIPLITALLLFGLTWLAEIIVQKLKKSRRLGKTSSVIPAVAAVLVFLTGSVVGVLDKNASKPTIEIRTDEQRDEINIFLKVLGNSVASVSVDYPVLGVITRIQDLNSVTEANPAVMRVVGGSTGSDVQNNLEIKIEDVQPEVQLQYKLFYTPSPAGLFIGGTDKYHLSYHWQYKGDILWKSEWRMVKDDTTTTPPTLVVKGARFFNRALTKDEIKKHYEQGLEKRSFKR